MALPVVTANSPSAGYIAWTAFGMEFNGVGFPVAAGNTNKKFTWWQYNAGVPTIVSNDVLPTLATEDMLLFLNKSGIGLFVPYTDVTDGSLIVTGSILAAAIGANQINASHIVADTITATQIAADAITASELAAGAVTASSLTIGAVSDNMVVNGSFEDTQEAWATVAGDGVTDVVTGVATSGINCLRMVRGTVNTTVTQAPAFYIPVSGFNAAAKWYVSCAAGSSATIATGFYFRVFWFQADKVTAATTAYIDVAANVGLTTTFALFEAQVVPPANARYMALAVYNVLAGSTIYVDELTAYETIVSAQIRDGAIVASKISAGAIDASKISAGALDAYLITGMNMQTSLTAARGLKFSNTGILGYDSVGNNTFGIDATTGAVTATNATISGLIRTGTAGQRVEISSTSAKFTSPTIDGIGSAATITAVDNGASQLALQSAAAGYQTFLGDYNMAYGGNVGFQSASAYFNDLRADTIRLYGTGDASLSSSTHGFQVGPDSGANVIIDQNELMARNNGGAATMIINNDGGNVTLGSSTANVNLPGRLVADTLPWAESVGSVTTSASATTSVTFPTGRFAVAPRVFAQITSGTSTISVTWVTGITATGFDIRTYTLAGAQNAVTVGWHAIEMTASASSG